MAYQAVLPETYAVWAQLRTRITEQTDIKAISLPERLQRNARLQSYGATRLIEWCHFQQ